MKSINLLFGLIFSTIISCSLSTDNNNTSSDEGRMYVIQKDTTTAQRLFSLSDAEKILGEAAQLIENEEDTTEGIFTSKCVYKALKVDKKTGKTGVIYFMFEQYKDVASATNSYTVIQKANENHEGVVVLHNMGDEAYFHSDGSNFLFILVRKGAKMIRMKLNKTTSHTSNEAFDEVGKKITDAL